MAGKFICNGMLGKLCKLLRIYGIDSLYTNQGMSVLLVARREKRIILTKNTRLRGHEGVFFVEDSSPVMQLKDVINEYNLQNEVHPFSRCLVCNDKLVSTDKKSVTDKVPYFICRSFDEFAICPKCQRIYWKGSHYERMLEELRDDGILIPNVN